MRVPNTSSTQTSKTAQTSTNQDGSSHAASPSADADAKVPSATSSGPAYGETHFEQAAEKRGVAALAADAPSSSPRDVVAGFYQAFARKDGAAMAAAYAAHARFSDPVFPSLDGKKAGAMWRMLTRSEDLKVRHEILKVDGDVVTAKWIANYSAPGTGKPVENHITATITVKDGKIVKHDDFFDMNAWVRMAYGGIARLPFMSSALAGLTRHLAGRQLDAFVAKQG